MNSLKSPLAAMGRLCMAALFVGTLWMASAGCEVEERGHDHDHDRHEVIVDHDHPDHDHHDWH